MNILCELGLHRWVIKSIFKKHRTYNIEMYTTERECKMCGHKQELEGYSNGTIWENIDTVEFKRNKVINKILR